MIIAPPSFIERMIIDSPTFTETRKKYFSGQQIPYDEAIRVSNTFPKYAHTTSWGNDTMTMLSLPVLENLRYCIEDTIRNKIEGDLVETGVWRGGATILAKYIYEYYGVKKKVFVADSFEGLPPPNKIDYPDDEGDRHYLLTELAVSMEQVMENFRKFGMLDENVIFIKGWFKNTLHKAPIDKLSILRLDGDMAEATTNSLEALYPKLSIGGYCIIDDFNMYGCRNAYLNYRKKYNLTEEISEVSKDVQCVFWKKEK